MLYIRRTLVLSTKHLEQETMFNAQGSKNYIASHLYGAYFDVGDVGEITYFEDPEDYPPDLYRCLLFARNNKCDEVKFSVTGPVVEGVPVYEW